MRVLVFRLRGPLGHFRRAYTTTSARTHSFPPRTAILGIIGAILGIDRKKLHRTLGNLKVSVSIEKPIRRRLLSVNYLHTKETGRTQIPLEVLITPSFLVFVSDESFKDFKALEDMLKKGESVFTPYLGMSEFIAKVEYIGTYKCYETVAPSIVHTVVPSSLRIKPEKDVLYLKERAVRAMNDMRNYIEHETYTLRPDGKPILIAEGKLCELEEKGWVVAWM